MSDGRRAEMSEKKKFLLRLDAALFDALEKWAADDLRSVNAQIEFLLASAAKAAGRTRGDPRPPEAAPR